MRSDQRCRVPDARVIIRSAAGPSPFPTTVPCPTASYTYLMQPRKKSNRSHPRVYSAVELVGKNI